MSSSFPQQDSSIYQNIHISGHARALLGNCGGSEPVITGRADFAGAYAHSSLRPVATYVSRPDLERQLRDLLPPHPDDGHTSDDYGSRMVVVWGLGGSGKSQLVLNHVRAHRRQYRAVFWVEAGQKETIERDYLQIYKLLFPSAVGGSATIAVEDAINAVKSWLDGQQGRCLWVMDSADAIEDEKGDDFIDLEHFLPDTPQLDRIMTTRSARAQSMSSQDAVAVAEMGESEAAQLFWTCAKLKRTSDEMEREIVAIVQELGCLALAVTLAGSYVSETPRLSSNLRLFLPEYREHRQRLLSRRACRNVHRYSDSVLSTWDLSFSAVERQSPVAARLLTLVAFLNFDDIFLRLFVGASLPTTHCGSHQGWNHGSNSRDSLQWELLVSPGNVGINEYIIEAAFATLQTYSLVSWREEQEAYVTHKLVHAWAHDRLEVAERQTWSRAALELLDQVVRSRSDDFGIKTRMVPHVMANFTAMSAVHKSVCESTNATTDRDRDAIGRLANLLWQLGRWGDEYRLRLFLQRATESALGREHPHTLLSMDNLAGTLANKGKYEEAEQMQRQTLELCKKVLGFDHPSTLTSMDNLAAALRDQGKYGEAEQMHRQTLGLRKRVQGLDHPDTLTSMDNLAMVLRHQGKYEEAKQMHRQTLELRKRVLGLEHPSTITSMNNLALALRYQGKV